MLDGKVLEVNSTGIHVQSGPIKTFISMKVNFSKLSSHFCRKGLTSTATSKHLISGSQKSQTKSTELWKREYMSDIESLLGNISTTTTS